MDQEEILKTIHKVGHSISGEVIGYEYPEYDEHNDIIGGQIVLKTESKYKTVLSIRSLFDYQEPIDKDRIPKIGAIVNAVIANFSHDILFLRARPIDLLASTQKSYADFYSYTDKLKEGDFIFGMVARIAPFGMFIRLDSNFVGVIDDIGYTFIPQYAKKMPKNREEWPKVGDRIRCMVVGFRLDDRQINLLWAPE